MKKTQKNTPRAHHKHQYRFKEQFHTMMEVEKAYLNPALNLVELADTLGTNRTYISQYLNKEMQCSFYDYVNSLRIRAAAEMLQNSEDKIEFIAMHTGFNSITTFRRIFMKFYGMTASDYRKNCKKKD